MRSSLRELWFGSKVGWLRDFEDKQIGVVFIEDGTKMDKIRKYFFEAGLSVYTSYKALIPVEMLLEQAKTDRHNYHIYAILACAQFYYRNEKTYIDDDGLHATIFAVLDGKEKEFNLPCVRITDGLRQDMVELHLVYPYETLQIKIIDEEFLSNSGIEANIINIPANSFLDNGGVSLVDTVEYEVLYIGQSFGKDGNRTALDRLSAHSTLQKILGEAKLNYPGKHIYLLLLEMASNLSMSFDGVSKVYKHDANASDDHMKLVLSDLPKENQIINVAEAAMIYYFKPVYNTKLVENFPNPKAKSYRQYFDLDYNSITVELDLEFDCYPHIILFTETNSIKSVWDFIRYPLHNEKDRLSMYDIFGQDVL